MSTQSSLLDSVRFASKKAGGSSKNLGGKSPGQRYGFKKQDGNYKYLKDLFFFPCATSMYCTVTWNLLVFSKLHIIAIDVDELLFVVFVHAAYLSYFELVVVDALLTEELMHCTRS